MPRLGPDETGMAFLINLMLRFIFISAALLFFPHALSAQDRPAEELIRLLGSPKFGEREEATRALERLGPKALPALTGALAGPLEVSQRARNLIEKIKDRETADGFRKPQMVRWDLEGRSVAEVLDQVQMDWKVPLHPKLDRDKLAAKKVTLRTEPLPFWHAWDRFCKEADLGELMVLAADHDKMALVDFDTASSPFIVPRSEAPRTSADLSGPVRARGLILAGEAANPDRLILEIRPQPGLGWLTLESVELHSLTTMAGEPVAPPKSLYETHQKKILASRWPWDLHFDRQVSDHRPLWPADTISLSLLSPAKKYAWRQIEGTIQARVFLPGVETCLENIARKEGKTWENSNGVRGKLLDSRITDEGVLCLRLRLDNYERWLSNYPGPKLRKVRPGLVVFLGPGDFAAELLQVRDEKGRSLPRVQTSIATSEDGIGLELDLHFQGQLGGEETYSLLMLRPQVATLDFPFVLRDLPVP